MSTQDKSGAWVVPPEQVKEFMATKINYKSLINDCLNLFRTKKFVEQPHIGIVNKVHKTRKSNRRAR